MLKELGFAALAAGLSFTAVPALAASPVVGSWATEISVQDLKIAAVLTVAEAAGGYSVDIKDAPMPGAPGGPEAQAMPSKISDVAVDGAKLTFKRHLTTPQGEMDLAYALTAEGDTLSGQIDSSFGAIPLTGKRR
ncbi:MAG: hypothetical protein ABIP41_00815 [Croceibacterium sp.]